MSLDFVFLFFFNEDLKCFSSVVVNKVEDSLRMAVLVEKGSTSQHEEMACEVISYYLARTSLQ